MKRKILVFMIVLIFFNLQGYGHQIQIFPSEDLGTHKSQTSLSEIPFQRQSTIQYKVHDPISINGNDDFINQAAVEGWMGDGSELNPYIIERLNISGLSDVFIEIRSTEVFFQISSCLLKGGRYGIYLQNVSNVQIINNTIIDSSFGLWIDSSENVLILNNNITESSQWGVWLDSCNNSIVSNNIINNNSEYGIHLEYSWNSTVVNNMVFDNRRGISFASCKNNFIQNNQVCTNGDGIEVGYSMNNYIYGNQVYNNSDGIQVRDSVNNTLVNNTISNNFAGGVRLSGTVITTFSNNNVSNNTDGISLDWSHISVISNNTISNNHYHGIYMSESRTNILANNTFFNNSQHGIYLQGSELNILARNTIYNHSYSGISFINANNNTIFHNTVGNTSNFNVILTYSGHNNMKWNNFLKNDQSETSQARDDDDQGRKNTFAYNYWDDWTSPDSDADEIVDNPYIINGSSKNQDRYPRSTPIDLLSDTTAPIFSSTPTDFTLGLQENLVPPDLNLTLNWIAVDDNPAWYIIFSYEVVYDEALMQLGIAFTEHVDIWFSSVPITLKIDWLDLGKYTYTCMVVDAAGYVSFHTVTIRVIESITTTPIAETTTTPIAETTTTVPPSTFTRETPGWTFLIILFSIIAIMQFKRFK